MPRTTTKDATIPSFTSGRMSDDPFRLNPKLCVKQMGEWPGVHADSEYTGSAVRRRRNPANSSRGNVEQVYASGRYASRRFASNSCRFAPVATFAAVRKKRFAYRCKSQFTGWSLLVEIGRVGRVPDERFDCQIAPRGASSQCSEMPLHFGFVGRATRDMKYGRTLDVGLSALGAPIDQTLLAISLRTTLRAST